MFPDLDAKWLEEELADAERSDASLMPTKEAAERILMELFGNEEEVARILDLPPNSWANEVVRAYLRVLQDCGATHVTSTAIFDQDERCIHYLIHAAKSPQAAYKMKEANASATSKTPLPDGVKHRIRWAHLVRMEEVVPAVLQHFGGQEVNWSDRQNRLGGVRGFALSETPMFPEQAKDLKAALSQYIIQKKPLRYRFPSAE